MAVAHLDLSLLHTIEEPLRFGHATANFPGMPVDAPGRLELGPLRLCSYETFEPGFEGFPLHPHVNVEVITIVLDGQLVHRDTLGREERLPTHGVQSMSAGVGLSHEERLDHGGALLQLMFEPDERDLPARVSSAAFEPRPNTWVPLVGREPGALPIRADASIRRAHLAADHELSVQVEEGRRCLVVVIHGEVALARMQARAPERLIVDGPFSGCLRAINDAEIVAIDVA